MDDDLDSESGSQNGLRGLDVKDPAQEKQRTMATRERPGTPEKRQNSGCSCHEQAVSGPAPAKNRWYGQVKIITHEGRG